MSASLRSMSELAAPGNTPSLDDVRERIERRYANAMGRAELAGNSVEGRMLEVQKSTLDMAGASRLDQIRQSMQVESGPQQPAVGPGQAGGHAGNGAGTGDAASAARLAQIRASLQKPAGSN